MAHPHVNGPGCNWAGAVWAAQNHLGRKDLLGPPHRLFGLGHAQPLHLRTAHMAGGPRLPTDRSKVPVWSHPTDLIKMGAFFKKRSSTTEFFQWSQANAQNKNSVGSFFHYQSSFNPFIITMSLLCFHSCTYVCSMCHKVMADLRWPFRVFKVREGGLSLPVFA